MDDVDEGTRKGIDHVQGQGHQVPVKEPVIAATNAVAQPRTVVVEVLDAVVANRAVRTSIEQLVYCFLLFVVDLGGR